MILLGYTHARPPAEISKGSLFGAFANGNVTFGQRLAKRQVRSADYDDMHSSVKPSAGDVSLSDSLRFDIFSPLEQSDVTNQVERPSSNETKIAPKLVRIAVGSAKW
jgi:hypothetical protein